MSRSILVTGISGFLGAEIARRLVADGARVGALIRKNSALDHISDLMGSVEFFVYDGSMESLSRQIRDFSPDLVMHLASRFLAEHRSDDIDDLVQSNVLFPTQLVEAMAMAGCKRLINTGTSWQHFGSTMYRPVNLYAATKQAFEDVLRFYGDAHGLSYVTLQLYDTYGPRDRRRKLIRLLIEASRTGTILEMSPGQQVIDLVHSDDVVEAFLGAARRLTAAPEPLAESFLVSGSRVTLRDLVALLSRQSGRPIHVAWGTRPYRAREVMLPVDAAGLALPGWSPQVALEDGLRSLIEAYD